MQTHNLIYNIIDVLSFCFFSSAVLWITEYCTDCFKKDNDFEEWTWSNAVWFVITTIMTLGFGEYAS